MHARHTRMHHNQQFPVVAPKALQSQVQRMLVLHQPEASERLRNRELHCVIQICLEQETSKLDSRGNEGTLKPLGKLQAPLSSWTSDDPAEAKLRYDSKQIGMDLGWFGVLPSGWGCCLSVIRMCQVSQVFLIFQVSQLWLEFAARKEGPLPGHCPSSRLLFSHHDHHITRFTSDSFIGLSHRMNLHLPVMVRHLDCSDLAVDRDLVAIGWALLHEDFQHLRGEGLGWLKFL